MGEEYERFRSVSFGDRALSSVDGKHVDLKNKKPHDFASVRLFFYFVLDLKRVLPNLLLHAQRPLLPDWVRCRRCDYVRPLNPLM